MTIQEKFDIFLNRWNNKYADFDGYYGGQCYDLAQFWTKELGGHTFIGMYAKDIYSQPKDFYIQIPNTPDAVPQVGDIVVWAGSFNGGVGHVAIATGKGNKKTFEVFSQNDPTGSKCISKTYKYDHVTGWLRAKVQDSCSEKIKELETEVEEIRVSRNKWKEQCGELKHDIEELTKKGAEQIAALHTLLDKEKVAKLQAQKDLETAINQRPISLSDFETKVLVTEVINRIIGR